MTDTTYRTSTTAIAIAGSVDSGKSSFIGVLISGKLDDGNGSARKLVATHEHEVKSGKTSSISTRVLDIPEKRSALTIIDLCGHEQYFHTTTYGLAGYFPDYAFLVVSANRGVLQMTKQHIRVLLSLCVPIIIIVTHIDITPVDIYNATIADIKKTITAFFGKSATTLVVNNCDENEDNETKKRVIITETVNIMTKLIDGRQIAYPVISISNKTGYFIDVVAEIIKQLPPRQLWTQSNKIIKYFSQALTDKNLLETLPKNTKQEGSIFYIDNCYNPPGIGLVVTGINRGATIDIGSTMYIGPINKEFVEFRVKGMHNNMKQNIPELKDHYRGTIAMALSKKENIKRNQIRKGMVVLSSLSMAQNVCYHFKAIITFFAKSVTIKSGYTPVIHMGTIRQSARIIINPEDNNNQDVIGFDGKSNNFAIVTFKFVFLPEYIEPYNTFLIRSGEIHGIGMIINTLKMSEDINAKPDNYKIKQRHIRKIDK
jgi:elongation factor 1-alpha